MGENEGITSPPKLVFKGLRKKDIMGQNIPISSELASGKKLNGKKRIPTKKISPKRDNKTPELKRLFEKIRARKEKEKDAAKEKRKEKKDDIFERANEIENVGGLSRIVFTTENPQGDGNKAKKIINNFEKKMKENITVDSNPSHSPSSKFQRRGKLDVLRRLDTHLIKKADSPTRRKKLQNTVKKKIPSEAIRKESLSLNCGKNKEKDVDNFQRTLWDILGPEPEKKGALN